MDHQHHLLYLQQVVIHILIVLQQVVLHSLIQFASCEDLVQSVQQKVNTDAGKHKTIRICTSCKKEGCDQHGEKKRSP